jgi:hypothetical protein
MVLMYITNSRAGSLARCACDYAEGLCYNVDVHSMTVCFLPQ